MKRSLLLSAYIGSENLGDEAVFRSISEQLARFGYGVTALSINPARTNVHGVLACSSYRFWSVVRAIRDCDVFLMGGGGILQDESSLLNLLFFFLQLRVARYFGKPIIFCFVGVGPLRFRISRLVLQTVSPHVALSVVRDAQSIQELVRCAFRPETVHLAHDAAMSTSRVTLHTLPIPGQRKRYVIVALRRWFYSVPLLPAFVARRIQRCGWGRTRYRRFTALLASELDAFLRRNSDVSLIFVSFFRPDGELVAKDVVDAMAERHRTTIQEEAMSEERYAELARDSWFVLGMRLHALILASLAGKAFVSLSYSNKVAAFSERVGLATLAVKLSSCSNGDLTTALRRIERDSSTFERTVRRKVQDARKMNEAAFQLVRRTIDALCPEPRPTSLEP